MIDRSCTFECLCLAWSSIDPDELHEGETRVSDTRTVPVSVRSHPEQLVLHVVLTVPALFGHLLHVLILHRDALDACQAVDDFTARCSC